jgi:hypothetical protein
VIAAIYTRKTMISTPTIVALATLLGGCVPTLAEIRAAEPQHVGTFPGEYRKLARCTADALDSRTSWGYFGGPPSRQQLVEHDGDVEVTGFIPNGTTAIFEIRFRPIAADQTAVEVRHARHYGVQNRTLWPAVERCGGKAMRREGDR